jgi:FlaA1/EpsC-like NDP-sugar epimerase
MAMEKGIKKIPKSYLIESAVFFILGIALFLYAMINHYSGIAKEWKMSPYLFPVLIAVFLVLLSVSLYSEGKRVSGQSQEGATPKIKTVFIAVLMMLGYFFLMPLIGFLPMTAVYLMAFFYFLGERHWIRMILLSAITSGLLYVIFDMMLNVMLP